MVVYVVLNGTLARSRGGDSGGVVTVGVATAGGAGAAADWLV
jgi:hypothetical protein